MSQRCATLAEFRAQFPEFDAPVLTDAQVELILECTCHMINLECWGKKALCGHLYLAAHFAATQLGEEAGPLTGKTIGRISESFSSSFTNMSGDVWRTTKYGRMYWAQYRTLLKTPIAARRRLPRVPPGFFFCGF